MADAPSCHGCQHVRYARILGFKEREYPKCAAVLHRNHVDARSEMTFCSIARGYGEPCGPQARLYQARDLQLIKPAHWSECPYCLKPVGLLGNWLAKLFGSRFHHCDFSNVTPRPVRGKPTPPPSRKMSNTIGGPVETKESQRATKIWSKD